MAGIRKPASFAGQVTLDHSLGQTGQSLSGPDFNISPGNGKTIGHNLFFSFTQFDLSSGDTATFSGPNTIQNILSRVTGGNPSSIDGLIRSTISGANFFFINPKGVIFGPNAKLDVSGSFAASTADYLKLADGARFVAAVGADDSALSSAPVSAFGFLGNSPGSIAVQQSTLSVPDGKTISLVGGNVTVDGAAVQSPAGQINVVSVQSAGEVPVDPTTLSVAEFDAAFPQQGQINLQNGAQLDASGDGGARIVIRGGALMVDSSFIQANTTGAADGQGIDIAVVNSLNVVNGGQINAASTLGLGAGGNINLTAASILVDGQGVTADDGFTPTTQIFAATGDPNSGGGPGKGGDIVIHAGSFGLVNSAQISTETFGTGNAGRIEITATSVQLDARNTTIAQITAESRQIDGGGNAGDIIIRTDSLDILNGAGLTASTFGSGDAGRIDITAQSVNLSNFGFIAPATFGTGNGGSITVTADSVLLDASSIQAVTTFSADDPNAAKGGNIQITAGSIDIRNGGQISATTSGSGAGGTVELTTDSISLTGDNGASGLPTGISAASGQDFGGGFILVGTGNGGDVVIKPKSPGALSLIISDGAQISTSTLGSGNGGRIDITASSLSLSSGGNISSASSSLDPGAGTAGNVIVKASDSIVLTKQGLITTEAPNANGGDISITAGSEIRVIDSQISAQAAQDGGNIVLSAPSLVYLLKSSLSASAGNNGGNILIDHIDPEFLVLNRSPITADAINNNGGNINIVADFFFGSDSPIHADSQFGNPGNILIQATQLDLSGSLVALPADLLDAESLLRPDCGVRLAGNISSFIVLGRGGLPLEPGGFVPSSEPTGADEGK